MFRRYRRASGVRIESTEVPRQAFKNLLDQCSDGAQRMIARDPVLNFYIREKLLGLFRPAAHRKSLRLARQTESHHNSKIDAFFTSLLEATGCRYAPADQRSSADLAQNIKRTTGIGGIIGSALVIYGRMVASRKIA